MATKASNSKSLYSPDTQSDDYGIYTTSDDERDIQDEDDTYAASSYWNAGDESTVGPWTTNSNLVPPQVRQLGHEAAVARQDIEMASNRVFVGTDYSCYELSVNEGVYAGDFETIDLERDSNRGVVAAPPKAKPSVPANQPVAQRAQEQAVVKPNRTNWTGYLKVALCIVFLFVLALLAFLFYIIWY